MARRIVHQLVDDIDGSVLEAGEGESIHFSLNGNAYEIDLNSENAGALREAFEPYIAAGRRSSTAAGGPRGGSSRKRSSSSPEIPAIRAWAQANGHAVSERGRIPAAIVEAYRAAH